MICDMTTAIGRPRVSDQEIQARVVAVLAGAAGRFMTGSQIRRSTRGEAVRIDEAIQRLIDLGIVRHGSRRGRYLLNDSAKTREVLAGFTIARKGSR